MHFLNKFSSVLLQNRPIAQRLPMLCELQKLSISQSSTLNADKSQKSKSLEEKMNLLSSIPEAPKRPLSAYLRFVIQIRPKVAKELPNASSKELLTIIGERWKIADKDTVLRLQNEFNADLEAYKKQKAKYDSSLSLEQQQALEEFNKESRKLKKRRQLKKKLKALGKPKRPPNAYVLFLTAKRTQAENIVNLSEWATKVASEWKSLPDSEKRVYQQKSIELRELYTLELEDWNKKVSDEDFKSPKKSTKSTENPSAKTKQSEHSVLSDTSSEINYGTNKDSLLTAESCFREKNLQDSSSVQDSSHKTNSSQNKQKMEKSTDRLNSKSEELLNKFKHMFNEFVKKKD